MTQREYEITVLGATGFTGKQVVKELLAHSPALFPEPLRWAAAGRSEEKLKAVLDKYKGQGGKSTPGIVLADTSDYDSLVKMCQKTKIVLNAVGPYRYYGEPVVRACIETGTDYLDLSGEPEFIEGMMLKYHKEAQAKGLTVVSASAFDSVPADMGALHAAAQIAGASPGAIPNGVEMFLRLKIAGGQKFGMNYATYESAVQGFGSAGQLRSIRKELAKERPKPKTFGKRPPMTKSYEWDPRVGAWRLPHTFSDSAIVRATQSIVEMQRKEQNMETVSPPIQFSAHVLVPSTSVLILLIFHFLVFSMFARYAWGRQLLLKYPKLFTSGVASKEGPSNAQIEATSFEMKFIAYGYKAETIKTHGAENLKSVKPDVEVETRWTGPEPGYVSTPILFLLCASTLLYNKHKGKSSVPSGVLTPASAFGNTDFMQRLRKDGRLQVAIVRK